MSIKVRYFASLAETVGRSESVLEHTEGMTVNEVWRLDNPERQLPGQILASVNMDYAGINDCVNDGDEVAFFPPVTGG